MDFVQWFVNLSYIFGVLLIKTNYLENLLSCSDTRMQREIYYQMELQEPLFWTWVYLRCTPSKFQD